MKVVNPLSKRDGLIASRAFTALFKEISERGVEEYFDLVRDHGVAFIDSCIETSLINDHEAKTSKRDVLLGILMAASRMMEQSTSGQARHELQAQNEQSQFGMQLADSISDESVDLVAVVDRLINLNCHYNTVLYGRRELNVHYTDSEGSSVRDEKQTAESGELT